MGIVSKLKFLPVSLLVAFSISAQNLDSLWKVYKNESAPDTNRLKAIHAIAWRYAAHYPDSAILLAKQELQLAKEKKQRVYEGTASNTLGVACSNKGEYESSLKHYFEALTIWKELGKETKIANALYNIGINYRKIGDYKNALKHYFEALKIHERNSNKAGMSMCYNTIAIVYDTHAEYKNALVFHKKSLTLAKELNDMEGVAIAFNGLGQVYDHKEQLDSSLYYYFESVKIHEAIGNKRGLGIAFNNIGLVFKQKEDFNKALEYYHKSLKFRQETQNIPGIASCYNNIGELYHKLGQFKESIGFLEKGLELSKQVGDIESMRHCYEYLSAVYAATGNYKLAYENQKLYKEVHDSIFNSDNSKALGDLKTNFEVEKKEIEMRARAKAEEEKIRAVNELEKKQQKTIIFLLIGGCLLIALALLVAINRFRMTRKQKIIIEQQKLQVDEAFDQLHEKNQEVLDSIYYARRIQQALITNEKYIHRKLKELKDASAKP